MEAAESALLCQHFVPVRRGKIELWKAPQLVPYPVGLKAQEACARLTGEPNAPRALILTLEHAPVYTVGRRGAKRGFPNRIMDTPVFSVHRGGDITFHGPGQAVAYIHLNLRTAPFNIRQLVCALLDAMRATCEAYGLAAEPKDDPAGLWAGGRKIGAVGLGVSQWVTYHGVALNVQPDLKYFSAIRPCGLEPDQVTSMAAVAGKAFDMDQVLDRLGRDVTDQVRALYAGGSTVRAAD